MRTPARLRPSRSLLRTALPTVALACVVGGVVTGVVAGAASGAETSSPSPVPTRSAPASAAARTSSGDGLGGGVRFGVYAGPDSVGVAGARAFDVSMHQRSRIEVDFTPLTSWQQIEGESWLLDPHARSGTRLEYSVPVVPDIPGASLRSCADGSDDVHWSRLAHNLVAAHLADTIVRPGWEFNGGWFAWSAAGHPKRFAACFRHVVRTMRRSPGQHFAFDWNVAVGPNAMTDPAAAWPGRRFVDVVGVDVYDMSWSRYSPDHRPTPADRRAVLDDLIHGPQGLDYWARFASRHHRRLALPEWGVTWRADGHGGGDDPAFVRAVFRFVRDPSHDVAYADYFDSRGATVTHALDGRTRFPRSAAVYRRLVSRRG